MFVYPIRQSLNIFRSVRLQTRKRMWMFVPATWICLPGNGWKEQSPWMSRSSARWLGGDPPTALLLEWTKVGSHGEDPCQAQLSPEALSGPLSWLPQLQCCVLLEAGIGQSHPLKARTSRWLSFWEVLEFTPREEETKAQRGLRLTQHHPART